MTDDTIQGANEFLTTLDTLAKSVPEELMLGNIFRCEGMLANALVHTNRQDASKLVRKQLANLAGGVWGISEDVLHPALVSAAKGLLAEKS